MNLYSWGDFAWTPRQHEDNFAIEAIEVAPQLPLRGPGIKNRLMNALQATGFDHLLVTLLAVVLPVAGLISIRKIRRQVAAGVAHTTRVADYRNNMIIMWSVTLLTAILWSTLGRDWSTLGLGPVTGSPWLVGTALLLAGGLVGFNLNTYRRVQQSASVAQELLAKTADFEMLLPHTEKELRWFYGLSVTAGITEEILYRGFLIAYLLNFLHLPAAMVVSSLVFASAHLYQGIKGASRTFLVGLAMATAYVLTSSVLIAVVAHILVDVISGRMILSAFNRHPPTATAQETC